jgi:hypothetical protein
MSAGRMRLSQLGIATYAGPDKLRQGLVVGLWVLGFGWLRRLEARAVELTSELCFLLCGKNQRAGKR